MKAELCKPVYPERRPANDEPPNVEPRNPDPPGPDVRSPESPNAELPKCVFWKFESAREGEIAEPVDREFVAQME